MKPWTKCKKILCIRPDNMGDLLMSAPAMAALKQSFECDITVLTSPIGKEIAAYLPVVDDVIVWNAPWVKGTATTTLDDFNNIVARIREKNFDGAVIFTVFSQNPLPSALMATLADIPNRAAYCRENPYQLLSHWIPEKEPYDLLRHQVQRDLDLVYSVGARATNDRIKLKVVPAYAELNAKRKITAAGADMTKPWLILHPGVSETKREFDADRWIEAGRRIVLELGYQVIVTGVSAERALTEKISRGIGDGAVSIAGQLSLEELIALIHLAPLLISVNTGTVHLASAVQTKVIVVYALTNPQHPPWKAVGRVLPFSVKSEDQSRNETLRFLQRKYFQRLDVSVTADDILAAARELLLEKRTPYIEELVLPSDPGPRDVECLELPRAVELPEE